MNGNRVIRDVRPPGCIFVYVRDGVTATIQGWGGIGLRIYVSPCFIAFSRCV